MSQLIIDSQKDTFLDRFKDLNGICAAEERALALENLAKFPLPTTRDEAWKYTRIGRLVKPQWKTLKANHHADIQPFRIPGLRCIELVFINGQFQANLSDLSEMPGNIPFAIHSQDASLLHNSPSLSDSEKDIFIAFNTAYAQDGIYLHVPNNKCMPLPVHLIHLSKGENNTGVYRHKITTGQIAGIELISSFHNLDDGAHLSQVVCEISVGKNATVSWDKLQSFGSGDFSLCREIIYQEQDSHFTMNTLTARGNWVRNDIEARMTGVNSTCNLYGIYMPKKKEHVDNHTVIDHMAPHCDSNEHYKGIVYDKATGVFNGKVFVREDAQKTNAFQQNANILMSDEASMNSKPELEIYADDVKCSHGSTTGQFDEEALFYLKARGLNESSARALLVDAFLSEVFEHIAHEPIRDLFKQSIH